MTPSGIEPATFQFVAQHLNHCATISGPHNLKKNNPLFGITRQYFSAQKLI
jgi:hypothetical protein